MFEEQQQFKNLLHSVNRTLIRVQNEFSGVDWIVDSSGVTIHVNLVLLKAKSHGANCSNNL